MSQEQLTAAVLLCCFFFFAYNAYIAHVPLRTENELIYHEDSSHRHLHSLIWLMNVTQQIDKSTYPCANSLASIPTEHY